MVLLLFRERSVGNFPFETRPTTAFIQSTQSLFVFNTNHHQWLLSLSLSFSLSLSLFLAPRLPSSYSTSSSFTFLPACQPASQCSTF